MTLGCLWNLTQGPIAVDELTWPAALSSSDMYADLESVWPMRVKQGVC